MLISNLNSTYFNKVKTTTGSDICFVLMATQIANTSLLSHISSPRTKGQETSYLEFDLCDPIIVISFENIFIYLGN